MNKIKNILTALVLIVSLATVHTMVVLGAAPGTTSSKPRGELSVTGEVSVDGMKVVSGTTIFNDSVIVTDHDSHATINLNQSARIELAPDSRFRISVTEDGAVSGQLENGMIHAAIPEDTTAAISTKDGYAVADHKQNDLFTVSLLRGNTEVSTELGKVELRNTETARTIAAGEAATIGAINIDSAPAPQTTGNNFTKKGGYLLLALGAAAVAAIIIIAATNNDKKITPIPVPPVISPST